MDHLARAAGSLRPRASGKDLEIPTPRRLRNGPAVLSDARQIDNDVDPEILQLFCWSNSREFQQLRRIECAGANNDLTRRKHLSFRKLVAAAVGLPRLARFRIGFVKMFAFEELDAHRARAFKQDPRSERVKLDRQVIGIGFFGSLEVFAWSIPFTVGDCQRRKRQTLTQIVTVAQIIGIQTQEE